MIRLGLLGWPLAHSLSPKLQNAALSAVGLEGEYKLYPVDPAQPEKLAEFVNKIRAGECDLVARRANSRSQHRCFRV